MTVSSTTDISDFCDFFNDAKSKDKIQGKSSCTSNNKKANEGGSGGDSNTGGDKDGDNAAGSLGVNMAVLGLAIFAGIAQLL